MPELGESVHEGTVSRWLKKEGDFVKEDEPVVEITTDKVNTELPSPASGILTKILIPEGGLVQVFKAMGVIDAEGAATAKAPEPVAPASEPVATEAPAPVGDLTLHTGEHKFYTPVVRAMAKENNVSEADLNAIAGTGEGGRVTKKDVQAFIAARTVGATVAVPAPAPVAAKPVVASVAGPDQELTPLVGMRKMIADAMIRASQIPTVSTVTAVDVTHMVKFREINKESFLETHGVKLTYTPFFIKALAETLVDFPLVNAQLTPDNQILKTKGIHIGVAVALGAKGDEGLIVPVIRDCHTKTLIQVAKDLDAIAKKAREQAWRRRRAGRNFHPDEPRHLWRALWYTDDQRAAVGNSGRLRDPEAAGDRGRHDRDPFHHAPGAHLRSPVDRRHARRQVLGRSSRSASEL